MERLPRELFIEIFAYLNFDDLCQLTLTCKSFNEIISNSSALMDKFHLLHDKCDMNVDFWMMKKYRRIKIKTINENLMKLLEKCGEYICEISINRYKLEMKDFRAILTFCPHVKRLNIDVKRFICSNGDLTRPMIKLTLDSLTITTSNTNYFKILNISAKIMYVNTRHLNSTSKYVLVNFLRSQKQLKTLEIIPSCSELFNDDSLTNTDFQLETFAGNFSSFPDLNLEYFRKFMKNQKSLVRIIEKNLLLGSLSSEYANILRDFRNVRELKVREPFDFFHSFPYIEKLTIEAVCQIFINRNINDIFPNLKYLSVHSQYKIKFVGNFSESASKDCVELNISDNVKTLKVNDVRLGNDSLFDDNVDIKIENFIIVKSDSIDWLISCLKNDRMKLKSLTIEETQMKKSQQEYLESLTRGENKKIEKLKICMQMKLNENHDYVCDYQMENESNDAKRRKLK